MDKKKLLIDYCSAHIVLFKEDLKRKNEHKKSTTFDVKYQFTSFGLNVFISLNKTPDDIYLMKLMNWKNVLL